MTVRWGAQMHFDDASDEHYEPHDAPGAQVLPRATFQTPREQSCN